MKSLFLIIIILFQADIRRVLSRLGRRALAPHGGSEPQTMEEICEAAETLANYRIGGLIALERQVGLTEYLEGSVRLDSLMTWELLVSIFWPHNPIHDGAVIIQGDRIVASGCLLPLTRSTGLDPTLGTRHRAAVGLTENTDALALVVSETNGQISLAQGGKLKQNLSRLQLRQELTGLIEEIQKKGSWFERLLAFLGRNRSLKLLSLFLAVALWLAVGGEELTETNLNISLELLNLPSHLMVTSEVPSSIQVRVSGPRGLIRPLPRAT